MSQDSGKKVADVLGADSSSIRGLIIAGSPLLPNVGGDEGVMPNREFLVLFELFLTAVSEYADVVLPAASFAEVDGTFTNNDGFVQRVRKSIEPVHQSLPDWMIAARLAKELGVDFGFERSSSAVFREIAERIPAYAGLRYPLLKDEHHPVQVKHPIAAQRDLSTDLETIRRSVDLLSDESEKITGTPPVGHELFKLGTLTEKVPQFHLLAAGNPTPDTFAISPLYQITIDEDLKREPAVA
jgi:anaerobic selenocysteine-containing dehydrogenase